MAIEPSYQPKKHEEQIYQMWQQANVGSPESQEQAQVGGLAGGTHTILMPPPNLTGDLHAGHAFQHYLMDTITRVYRQKGQSSLWYPGVDHAGIQLEGVIDKLIRKGEFDSIIQEKIGAPDVAREDLPKWLKHHYRDLWVELAWSKVNVWRGNQKNQSAVLGDTPDYERTLFTLDERATNMVNYAFKKYWEDGLIYKGSYLVNWSVGLQTALSDVAGEIEYETRIDPFVTFEYEVKRIELTDPNLQTPEFESFIHDFVQPLNLWSRLRLGTVRIETKFTDLAVAMHPSKIGNYFGDEIFLADKPGFDATLAQLFLDSLQNYGLQVFYHLPVLESSELKLIFSDKVDPDFGTGIVKVTPGHDLFDYELYKEFVEKEVLAPNSIQTAIGRDGKLTEVCGEFSGLTVEQGRLAVMKRLAETGYIPVKDELQEQSKTVLADVRERLISEAFDARDYSYEEGVKILKERIGEVLQIDWNYQHNVMICERSKTVIEPLISEEFFLSYHLPTSRDGKSLQQLGKEGVRETQYFTSDFEDRAINFLDSIQDWCISRDLVWGHTMPIWYNIVLNPEKRFFSYKEYTENEVVSNPKYENVEFRVQDLFQISVTMPETEGEWVQEEKILDTWFSSCLWPLTTLDYFDFLNGKAGTDFEKFYPTQELISAAEIFYTWLVRMTILGKYFTGKIPFEKVVINPIVRDEHGRKMSKSLGNGLDAVAQIDKYSSDALRLAMLGNMIPNRNFRLGGALADKMCEKYRNFGNKLWNVARFLESKGAFESPSQDYQLSSASVWILAKYRELENELEKHLHDYEITHSIDALYEFLWDCFADWYVEYLKTDETQIGFARDLFAQYLITLSPYAPFETEVLWGQLFDRDKLLAFTLKDTAWSHQLWEQYGQLVQGDDFEMVIAFVESLRSTRGLFAIDPATPIEVFTQDATLLQYSQFIKLLARVDFSTQQVPDYYSVSLFNSQYSLNIFAYIKDRDAEMRRTEKLITDLEKQISTLKGQLNNQKFINNADPEVVAEKRSNLEARNSELEQQKAKLELLGRV